MQHSWEVKQVLGYQSGTKPDWRKTERKKVSQQRQWRRGQSVLLFLQEISQQASLELDNQSEEDTVEGWIVGPRTATNIATILLQVCYKNKEQGPSTGLTMPWYVMG